MRFTQFQDDRAQQHALYWAHDRRCSRVRSLTLKTSSLRRDLAEAQRRLRVAVNILQPHTKHTMCDVSPAQRELVKAINDAFSLLEWGKA